MFFDKLNPELQTKRRVTMPVPTKIIGFVSEGSMNSVFDQLKLLYPDSLEIVKIHRPRSQSEFNIQVPVYLWPALLRIIRKENSSINTDSQ